MRSDSQLWCHDWLLHLNNSWGISQISCYSEYQNVGMSSFTKDKLEPTQVLSLSVSLKSPCIPLCLRKWQRRTITARERNCTCSVYNPGSLILSRMASTNQRKRSVDKEEQKLEALCPVGGDYLYSCHSEQYGGSSKINNQKLTIRLTHHRAILLLGI